MDIKNSTKEVVGVRLYAVQIIFLAFVALSSCTAPQQRPADTSLYEALGAASGVEVLTENFIRELAADDRVRGRFRHSDIGRFHTMLQEFTCAETGGGCHYSGDDMKRSHGGLNISKAEFNAVVEALMRAMDKSNLPVATQNRLLALYAPMRKDIVGQ